MEKKKRFLRPSSFIMKRRSPSVDNSKGNSKKGTSDNTVGSIQAGSVEDRNDAFEQCKRLKTELETSNDKIDQYETEVELLRSQLRSLYRKELKSSEILSSYNTDSEDSELVINPQSTDIRPQNSYKACSDGDSDPGEHHSRPCKECEKLLVTRVSALVEAITLRRYVLQLNKMTENGEDGTQTFLIDNERKLTKTLAEKELLARQLKSIIHERDKILVERDRALEEWEKAASKWESTLDQLDTLMIQQNEAKERDNKTISRLKTVISEQGERIKEKDEANEKLREQMIKIENQLTASKKETEDCKHEHDVVLKANFNIAQELRRVNGELKETRTKCSELESSVEKTQTLLERNKNNNEHIVKQWKRAVKEKKKFQRDIPGIVQSRDEAIQRNLSTLAQLDHLRDERDKLARRLSTVEGTGSDVTEHQHSGTECQFCFDVTSTNDTPSYDEINVLISKMTMSEANITLRAVIIGGDVRVVVTHVDELLKQHNIRKYDDVVVVNQQLVVNGDVGKVTELINKCQTDLNLILRRYITPVEMTFEEEIPIPKKSKLGCGIHWGVYIRNLHPESQANASGNLNIGDYVNTINGKDLTKIMSHALDKYSKRGDKMSIQVSRKLSSLPRCSCDYNTRRHLNIRPRDKYFNRDSVISIESNQSLGASSISSIPSYISSVDSASVCSRTASESDGYFKTEKKTSDVFTIETGVPPTIAEESSTDDSLLHKRGRRVRSLTHLGKPKYLKKDSLPRSQSLIHSLDLEKENRPYSSNGRIVSVKRVQPESMSTQPIIFTVPVSKERVRVIRLDKRSGDSLGLQINGGNCVGIYVTGFHKQSLAEEAGVRVGDRLLQLNSFTFSQVTLDYATRIVRMLETCNYIRMEVQNYSNADEVLKEGTLDSLYVRARLPHATQQADEISYNIGDKLRVINTRADYDPVKQTWRWYAVRDRPGDSVEKIEGLIPAMNYSPTETDENGSNAAKSGSTVTVKQSEGDDGVLSDDNLRSGYHRSRRNSVESLSKLRRYRGTKRRASVDSIGSESDYHIEQKATNYYEILEEKQV